MVARISIHVSNFRKIQLLSCYAFIWTCYTVRLMDPLPNSPNTGPNTFRQCRVQRSHLNQYAYQIPRTYLSSCIFQQRRFSKILTKFLIVRPITCFSRTTKYSYRTRTAKYSHSNRTAKSTWVPQGHWNAVNFQNMGFIGLRSPCPQ